MQYKKVAYETDTDGGVTKAVEKAGPSGAAAGPSSFVYRRWVRQMAVRVGPSSRLSPESNAKRHSHRKSSRDNAPCALAVRVPFWITGVRRLAWCRAWCRARLAEDLLGLEHCR